MSDDHEEMARLLAAIEEPDPRAACAGSPWRAQLRQAYGSPPSTPGAGSCDIRRCGAVPAQDRRFRNEVTLGLRVVAALGAGPMRADAHVLLERLAASPDPMVAAHGR